MLVVLGLDGVGWEEGSVVQDRGCLGMELGFEGPERRWPGMERGVPSSRPSPRGEGVDRCLFGHWF